MQFFFRFFFITVVVFLFIRSANKAFTTASFRGYSGFQVTWMIEWGQKSKPQKIIGPKINPPPPKKKIPYTTTWPEYEGKPRIFS